MAKTSNTAKNNQKTEAKKTVAKENATTEKKETVAETKTVEKQAEKENPAPKTETVIKNNGLEQTVKEETSPKAENKGVDFDAKSYIITNPAKANKKVLGSRGQLIEFDSEGSAKVDMIEAQRYQTIPGYTVKES